MSVRKKGGGTAVPAGVESFLETLAHPHKAEILALRATILGAAGGIAEEVKWNAPSFRTAAEHFATFHLRAREGVQVVLHLGTKARSDARLREEIADPASLLEWRAADRATVTFRDAADVKAKGAAFAEIVRQWVKFV